MLLDPSVLDLIQALVSAFVAAGNRVVMPKGRRAEFEKFFVWALLNEDLLNDYGAALLDEFDRLGLADYELSLALNSFENEDTSRDGSFCLPAFRLLTGGLEAFSDNELAFLVSHPSEMRKAHELLVDATANGDLSPIWARAMTELGPAQIKLTDRFEMMK